MTRKERDDLLLKKFHAFQALGVSMEEINAAIMADLTERVEVDEP